jgi:predicted small lipoprotein YifL
VFALAALAGLGLAACGRVGQLEPPGGVPHAQSASPSPDQAISPQAGKPKIPPIVPPNKPFFLDFLIK